MNTLLVLHSYNFSVVQKNKIKKKGRMVVWEGYARDETMGIIAPIAVYWVYAGVYQLMGGMMEKYSLHSLHEHLHKNVPSLPSVVRGVLLQQLVQASISYFGFLLTSSTAQETGQPPITIQMMQMLVAMFVFDTCQYFVHRYMHHNKFLYQNVHSQHHRLVVPYAVGALYNHPVEAFFDTLGGAAAFFASGMTPRTAVWFFCLITLKTVDDHCGLWLPGNVFHLLFNNNGAYHDVHHQLSGVKFNYSQPFFSFWDRVLGTYMPYYLLKRPEGGFEVRMMKQQHS
ncbi:PREDICTED: sphinganine C4-monooxygenase 1-like [Tarenaya hassleriana]|uniref:sphinganine C4-monooxygenase 1-like n=1 Tax=Tarenaya hassleriana TaxID=28532 RepID=UPI00053C53CF|nr:PREDICTED: sphinganine C4-monooxygenase 1-like [Tarenaya hassleriana]